VLARSFVPPFLKRTAGPPDEQEAAGLLILAELLVRALGLEPALVQELEPAREAAALEKAQWDLSLKRPEPQGDPVSIREAEAVEMPCRSSQMDLRAV
jgi:hypothetical protein